MNFISTVYAQDQAPAGGTPPSQGGVFGMFLPLILIFIIFYFLIFRPQQKQQKLKQKMIAELKRGDDVVTNGGIYGKITDLADTFVMLQVANNVTIKLDRSQVNVVRNTSETQMVKK
ncbi:MAG: preprotein translocase subunit YajC [Deltaproteobacteria bacterium]|nr:preprotein translocase subunit YajC [Deltaproteobacteria bacterium]